MNRPDKRLLLLLLFVHSFCYSQYPKSLEFTLKKQLKEGANWFAKDGSNVNKDSFTVEELKVADSLLYNVLKENGFQKISDDEFKNKIQTLFNRQIIINSEKSFVYLNELNPCNKNDVFQKNDNINYLGYFIFKKNGFISEFYYIPEILDYNNIFPNLIPFESSQKKSIQSKQFNINCNIEKWSELLTRKDEYNLAKKRNENILKLVARNKYLFNNSREDFLWLIQNDMPFMKSLVTKFNFYEDADLMKWVVLNTTFEKTNLDEINCLIYSKKCNGKLNVNNAFLKSVKENSSNVNDVYNFLNEEYLNFLLINEDLNFSEKAQIIATVQNFIYLNHKEYNIHKYLGFFAEFYDNKNSKEVYSKEFEKNNYYSLPRFKEQWQEAKEEGDGIANPGQE